MNRGGQGGHGGFLSAGEKPIKKKLGDDEFTKGELIEGASGREITRFKEVMQKEDLNIQSRQSLALGSLSLSGLSLPIRPSFGREGKKILLKTNSFRMEFDPTKPLFKYNVDLQSDNKNRQGQRYREGEKTESIGRRVKKRVFALLFETSDFRSLGAGLASDFVKNVLTSQKLDFGNADCKIYHIQYSEIEDKVPRPNPTTYQITIKFEGTVPLPELLKYLTLTTAEVPEFAGKDSVVQALNIIMATTPNKDSAIFQAGVNKFFPFPNSGEESIDLSGGLIAVRGFFSSVRTSTMQILLNVNAQCSPFYPAVNMYVLMGRHSGWTERHWRSLETFIEKLRVKIRYRRSKEREADVVVKTIIGLSHEQRKNPETGRIEKAGNARVDHGNSKQIKFNCNDFPGENPISVASFFRRKYGISLEFPEAWLLNCGTYQNPIWIPPELCEVMPGQSYRGKLSEAQTTKMLTVAARPPAENARRIVGKGLEVIGINSQNLILSAFGVTVEKDMLVVEGRILDPPEILYKVGPSVRPTAASWNMINQHFATPKSILTWTFLTLGNARLPRQCLDQFRNALKSAGMGEEPPLKPQGQSNPGYHANLSGDENLNCNTIRDVIRVLFVKGVQFILVILPSNNAATYARVKYWADVKAGIHTSCAIEEKLKKGPQYFANIALKINQKFGGINHTLPAKKLGFLEDGTTMIVGLDVTHPAPKSMEGTPSIAGVVASVDAKFCQWPASIRCQKSRQEIVEDLDTMMVERLNHWKQKNKGKLPEKLLIYRDGVSEGQYKTVLQQELPKIQKACGIYGPNSQPKVTIIVVGKRHHTRFYPISSDGADRSSMSKGNPKAGTVVDRIVTMERGFDFYMQAHACIQGTAKPCHYVVIHDEMKLGADEIQSITHRLCYLYARATKAVSICPPAYYADLLCERGRCYIQKYLNTLWPPGKVFDPNECEWYHQGVHTRLKDSMFYL